MRPALVLLSVLLGACAMPNRPDRNHEPIPPMDPHSHARPAEARVRHVSLDLTADFARKRLHGAAALRFERRDPTAPLRLDSDGLEIERIESNGEDVAWSRGRHDENLGTEIVVDLPSGADQIVVHYRTRPDAAAVQWLEPEQTDGGERPYLFTQGQAILTRSWIPLQDSPGVRVTYDAVIRVDPALGIVPVMSASERVVVDPGTVRFTMDKPIPPYLIALAIGDLESRHVSARCAIWSEPGVVDFAARELADTEQMIVTCEELFGPYRWGRYDVLILPPAFPFGGMENPCLTFATPTILAGDKSLVALIAHELAHSWSGNLVTNATWRDFWLNEGFTVYLEQRIIEAVYGPERARMETLLGLRQLAKELRELPRRDQRLHIDLRGRNPDDGMTSVPYDKGAAFLRRLEAEFGRARFDEFLTEYFDAHAFRSITTDEFLDYLEENLPGVAAAVDIDAWVRGEGLPGDHPRIDSPAFDDVDQAREQWLSGAGTVALGANDWVTTEWLHFLKGMPATLDAERMAELDASFGLTESGNSEILAAWLELAIRHQYAPAMPALEAFLLRVGRRKFLVPLYKALLATESGQQRARAIYAKARPRYHAVSTRTLDTLLGVSR